MGVPAGSLPVKQEERNIVIIPVVCAPAITERDSSVLALQAIPGRDSRVRTCPETTARIYLAVDKEAAELRENTVTRSGLLGSNIQERETTGRRTGCKVPYVSCASPAPACIQGTVLER